jgi:2-aminoadipate transaminase
MSATQVVRRDKLRFAKRVEGLQGSPIDDLDTLLSGRHNVISLAGGTPHLTDIPADEIAELLTAAIRSDPAVLSYGLSSGDNVLRSRLIEFMERTENYGVKAGQLLVTSGAMQAIDLIAKIFLDPGDLVLVESPTFADALATFSAYEASVAEVPMDEDGIVVEAIPEVIAQAGKSPKLIYVIPTFQNPASSTMSLPRRQALLEVAERYGSVLIDDDPYRLLRYSGDPVPSLRALAGPSPNVVAIRSASKLIAPGLRVGWACASPSIVVQMVKAKQGMDCCTSSVTQRAVAGFLDDQLLERQLTRLTTVYRQRLSVAASALGREFTGTGVRWRVPDGGYFLWIELPNDQKAKQLLRFAVQEGVSFVPGPAFSPSGAFQSSLRLCFVAAEEDELRQGATRLRAAFDRLREVG